MHAQRRNEWQPVRFIDITQFHKLDTSHDAVHTKCDSILVAVLPLQETTLNRFLPNCTRTRGTTDRKMEEIGSPPSAFIFFQTQHHTVITYFFGCQFLWRWLSAMSGVRWWLVSGKRHAGLLQGAILLIAVTVAHFHTWLRQWSVKGFIYCRGIFDNLQSIMGQTNGTLPLGNVNSCLFECTKCTVQSRMHFKVFLRGATKGTMQNKQAVTHYQREILRNAERVPMQDAFNRSGRGKNFLARRGRDSSW